MVDETYSFTYNSEDAAKIFKGAGPRRLLLGVLGSVEPRAEWNGCLLYEGPTPEDETRTACIGTRGAGADEVQRLLVEALERVGVEVMQLYEGGPEIREVIARVEGQRWVTE